MDFIKDKLLIIAGGGTGGHIFPGLSVAEAWKAKGGRVLFVGTNLGQEVRLIPKYGFELLTLKVGRLKGRGIFLRLKTLLGLPLAFLSALSILKKHKPIFVLGIGGYASAPVTLMASLLRLPTAVMDQNAYPGLTNRILGKFVKRIYLSFEAALPFFKKNKCLITGNPVRSQMVYTPFNYLGEPFNILVFGGSQGARAVNLAAMQAIASLSKIIPLSVTHQTGQVDFEQVKNFYTEHNVSHSVGVFFDNMQDLYTKAHLIICRSGAGAMTEIALMGRPSILVPYPIAADDHQTKNAEVFVKQGAALLIPQNKLTAQGLADQIHELLKDPKQLQQMAVKARELAKPRATEDILTDIETLLKK